MRIGNKDLIVNPLVLVLFMYYMSTKVLCDPLDIPEITIKTRDNYSLTIHYEIATKIGYLNAMMNWKKNLMGDFYIDMNIQDFQRVIAIL
jgi:hypothetical protein